MNKHIEEYLDYYVKLDNPQFAVMLNGKWGAGKTYFIKERIESWKNKEVQSNEEDIIIQPIYVSLFGVSNLGMINDAIKAELNPILYSKSAKVLKEVGKGLLKSALKINLDLDDKPGADGTISMSLDSLSLLKGNSSDIKGNKILVFDDLERCNLDIDDVFGYINRFIEHLNCKVILICDERKFNEDELNVKKYQSFKEKLIGRTFKFKSEAVETVEKFVISIEKQSNYTFLSDNLNLITEIYHVSQTDNLRSVQQALYDFNRLLTYIDINAIKGHEKFTDFIEGLLAHFFILYFEFKDGNTDILKLIPTAFFLNDDSEIKERVTKIQNKYNQLKKSEQIEPLDYILSVDLLIEFIKDGWVCYDELNKEIKNNVLFNDETNVTWKELRSWSVLDIDVFKEIFEGAWNRFYGNSFDNPYDVRMISDIFLELIENKVIDVTEENLVKVSKQNIQRLFREDVKFNERDSWAHDYKMANGSSFKDIDNCLTEERNKSYERMKSSFLENLFENITSDSVERLPYDLDRPTPSEDTNYRYISFFDLVNVEKTGHSILQMTAKGINYFKHFLRRRYKLESKYKNMSLDSSHKNELIFFKSLRKELKKADNDYDVIKNYQIKELGEVLKSVIARIEDI